MRVVDVLAELEGKHQFRDLLGGNLPAGRTAPNPERAAGLAMLERRRREGTGPAKLYDERGESWGCAMVAIPYFDWQIHCARNPELKSKDAETRNRAWHKFFREFGRMYGCDDSIGKRTPNAARLIVK
jgi:hypothetical protein